MNSYLGILSPNALIPWHGFIQTSISMSSTSHIVRQWTASTHSSFQFLLYFHPAVSFWVTGILRRRRSKTSMLPSVKRTERQKRMRLSVSFISFFARKGRRPSFLDVEASRRSVLVRVRSHQCGSKICTISEQTLRVHAIIEK